MPIRKQFDVGLVSDPYFGRLDQLLAQYNSSEQRNELENLPINDNSLLSEWAQGKSSAMYDGRVDMKINFGGTLRNHIQRIAECVLNHDVVIIGIPSGCGKSSYAPAILRQYLNIINSNKAHKESAASVDKMKAVHFMHSSIHALHTYQYVAPQYDSRISIGVYGDCVFAADSNVCNKGITEYVYTTYSSARQVLECHDSNVPYVIMDDADEITADLLHTLALVKKKIQDGSIKRVILFGTHWNRRIRETYHSFFMHHTKFETYLPTPYCNLEIIKAGGDVNSVSAFNAVDGRTSRPTQFGVSINEIDGATGYPNKEIIRRRCVELTKKLLSNYEANHSCDTYINPPGIVIFLPDEESIITSEREIKKYINTLRHLKTHAEILSTTGMNFEESTKILRQQKRQFYSGKYPIRICLTTPRFEASVTLVGINTIIDSGLSKSRQLNSIYDVYDIRTIWTNDHDYRARCARVGRYYEGVVYHMYSNEHSDQRVNERRNYPMDSDINNAFSKKDLLLMGNLRDKEHYLFGPTEDRVAELALLLGIQGFIHPSRDILPDSIGALLIQCFPSLPLDQALLLVYAKAHDLLFPAIILVACMQMDNPFWRKIGKDFPSSKNMPDKNLPILMSWTTLSDYCSFSDMMTLTDLVINFIVHKNEMFKRIAPTKLRVQLPNCCHAWITNQTLQELTLYIERIVHECNKANLCSSLHELRTSVDSYMYVHQKNDSSFVHMDTRHTQDFNIILSIVFGYHVLDTYEVPQKTPQSIKYWGISNDNGTMDIVVRPDNWVIKNRYEYDLMCYSSIDNNQESSPGTGNSVLLHNISPEYMLLYGNAYGSEMDHLNEHGTELTIYVSTGSIKFQCNTIGFLRKIHEYRKLIRLIPNALFSGSKHLIDGIINSMSQNYVYSSPTEYTWNLRVNLLKNGNPLDEYRPSIEFDGSRLNVK